MHIYCLYLASLNVWIFGAFRAELLNCFGENKTFLADECSNEVLNLSRFFFTVEEGRGFAEEEGAGVTISRSDLRAGEVDNA